MVEGLGFGGLGLGFYATPILGQKVFIVQMGRIGKSPFFQPLLPPAFVSQFAIAFDPFNFGLGVLQDGAALGGVVTATGNS